MNPKIWTIGHSTRSLNEFIELLIFYKIEILCDIRSYPGSKRHPHFNKENLNISLQKKNITYIHIPLLGGRRKVQPDSHNTAWKHDAFKGYADYMETMEFIAGIEILTDYARAKNTAYMCAEAVWWKCHRSLISDYLKAEGWEVLHIIDANNLTEHPYTKAAKFVDGKLSYKNIDIRFDF
jgi:uncharacterized protein (DUF488 family)